MPRQCSAASISSCAHPAINLAIAQRLGAELATFDIRMADCARALGIAIVAL